jgi:hypothetical protein
VPSMSKWASVSAGRAGLNALTRLSKGISLILRHGWQPKITEAHAQNRPCHNLFDNRNLLAGCVAIVAAGVAFYQERSELAWLYSAMALATADQSLEWRWWIRGQSWSALIV